MPAARHRELNVLTSFVAEGQEEKSSFGGVHLSHLLLQWSISSARTSTGWITVVHILAIISGCFRLVRQRKVSRLWWDDCFAGIALAVEIVLFPSLWLPGMTVYYKASYSKGEIGSQIVSSWIISSVFWTLLWSTRISFSLSIARFIPPGTSLHKAAILLSATFFAVLVICTAYMTTECARGYSTWSKEPPYQCILPSSIPTLLAFDFFADITLVIIPAWAFWGLTLARSVRRLIQACFAATSLTAAWNIIYTIVLTVSGQLSNGHRHGSFNSVLLVVFQPYILGPISLFVCNTLIVVTSLYRSFRVEDKPVVVMPSPSNVNARNGTDKEESAGTSQPASGLDQSGQQSVSNAESSRLQLTELNESDLTVLSTVWTDAS